MPNENIPLRLYIDSVDEEDWKDYLPTGIFYGVTTNPKLLAGAGIEFKVDRLADLARTAFELGAREIHLQVWGREAAEMLAVGRELAAIDPRVMVKVPITRAGILCARELISQGASVTLTALHSASQALIATALGACYAAPYLGRMTDSGMDGLAEVLSMQRVVAAQDSPLRLLVASIRQVSDLARLAAGGLNAFTLLPPLVGELLGNQLTDQAAESFQEAVERVTD